MLKKLSFEGIEYWDRKRGKRRKKKERRREGMRGKDERERD